LTRLPPDLVVEISDDRDSVPAGFEFTYEFTVKNIRALAQSARETELTIDFDDRLEVLSIDYRCIHVESSDDEEYGGKESGGKYSTRTGRSSYAKDSYDEEYEDGSEEISKKDLIYTCYLGRVSALGTQVVLATVKAPHTSDILVTEADVVAQNEGQWVTDNNEDSEETAVFANINVNDFNRLQTTSNKPSYHYKNTWTCRFAPNNGQQLPSDECYEGEYGDYSCESFNVSAYARCFGNEHDKVRYHTYRSECDCFSSRHQPAEFEHFICECQTGCKHEHEVLTGGGCQIDGAIDSIYDHGYGYEYKDKDEHSEYKDESDSYKGDSDDSYKEDSYDYKGDSNSYKEDSYDHKGDSYEYKGESKGDHKGESKGDHKGGHKGDSKGDYKESYDHKGDNKGEYGYKGDEHKGDYDRGYKGESKESYDNKDSYDYKDNYSYKGESGNQEQNNHAGGYNKY